MPLLPAHLPLLKDWAFPRSLFLLAPTKMLACSVLPCALLWGTNRRWSFSSCHQLPSCEQHLNPPWAFGRKRDAQYQKSWVKRGHSPVPTSTLFPLPEHGSHERLGKERAETPWGFPLLSRTNLGAAHSVAPGWAQNNITESAPSNWICFGSASVRNHYIMLSLRFSHYFCANSQKTMLIMCCSRHYLQEGSAGMEHNVLDVGEMSSWNVAFLVYLCCHCLYFQAV